MEVEVTNLSQLPLNKVGIIQELKCEGRCRKYRYRILVQKVNFKL